MSRQSLEYAESTPFVLGDSPLEYGEEDPLNVYGGIVGYAGHGLISSVEVVSGGAGVEEGRSGPVRLVVLHSSLELSDSSIQRLREDSCVSPVVCQSETVVAHSPYSLRELRSIMGWVSRSPIANEVAAIIPIEQEPSSSVYRTLIEFETTTNLQPVLQTMLETAEVPSGAYRIKVGRPYNNP